MQRLYKKVYRITPVSSEFSVGDSHGEFVIEDE
jgi:hypothetical protein